MHIDRALQLKCGDMVSCPADRGSAAFYGRVISAGVDVAKDLKGADYIWVTVRGPLTESVWPSNRLGKL